MKSLGKNVFFEEVIVDGFIFVVQYLVFDNFVIVLDIIDFRFMWKMWFVMFLIVLFILGLGENGVFVQL